MGSHYLSDTWIGEREKKLKPSYKRYKATCPECAQEYELLSDGITISGKCKCGHLGFSFIPQTTK